MIKASEIIEGSQLIKLSTNMKYNVVTNIVDDVIFLVKDDDDSISFHLFYDDLEDVVYAAEEFGVDLCK